MTPVVDGPTRGGGSKDVPSGWISPWPILGILRRWGSPPLLGVCNFWESTVVPFWLSEVEGVVVIDPALYCGFSTVRSPVRPPGPIPTVDLMVK